MRLAQISSNESAYFQQAVGEKIGLSPLEIKALSLLAEQSEVTSGQLAVYLEITSGAVTGLVDRLIRAGMVQRKQDARDRRKVIITVDPQGMQQAMSLYESMGSAAYELFNSFDDKALSVIQQYLEKSIEVARSQTTQLRS